jgi:hypothetical protein
LRIINLRYQQKINGTYGKTPIAYVFFGNDECNFTCGAKPLCPMVSPVPTIVSTMYKRTSVPPLLMHTAAVTAPPPVTAAAATVPLRNMDNTTASASPPVENGRTATPAAVITTKEPTEFSFRDFVEEDLHDMGNTEDIEPVDGIDWDTEELYA